MTVPNKFQYLPLFAALASLSLAGCSSSSDGDTAPPVATTTFVGVVADGYLVNAKVCLDLNDNKICDAGEPSATTTAGGAFSFEATQDQIDNNPVVLEATAGVTIDEDTGTTVAQDFTLTAPSGSTFVSPLTTLVQAELEANANDSSFDVDDAASAVQTALGTTVNVRDDYIAQSGSGSADDYQRLHEIAQVMTQVIADNLVTIDAAATTQGSTATDGELFELVVAQVSDELDTISNAVDTDTSATFDPDAVATSISTEVAVDTDNIDDQVAQQELEETATAANVGELLTSTGGLNWFWVNNDNQNHTYEGLETGTITHDTGTGVTTDIEYDVQSDGSLVVRTPGTQDLALGPAGWVSDDEKINNAVINADGSVDWDMQSDAGVTYSGETITGQRVDVSGQTIAPFILDEDGVFDATTIVGNALFSAGAEAYRLAITSTHDYYVLWEWDGCPDPASTGGSCNTVWHFDGDGDFGNDTDTQTMASVLVATAADPSAIASNPSTLNAASVGTDLGVELVTDGAGGTSGTANFYQFDFSGTPSASKLASGTWEQRTVSGETLYLIDVPASLRDNADVDPGEKVLFAERNGFVRRGSFEPNGTVDSDDEWVFNSVAWQDILDNYVDPAFPCNYQSFANGVQTNNSYTDFGAVVAACGGAQTIIAADIVGTWVDSTSSSTGIVSTTVFNNDNTFTNTATLNGVLQGSVDPGTWSVANNLLTLTADSGFWIQTIAFTANGQKSYQEVSSQADLIFDGTADGDIYSDNAVKSGVTSLACNYESGWDDINDQPSSFNSYTDFLAVVADCGGALAIVDADVIGTWVDTWTDAGVLYVETTIFNADGSITYTEVEDGVTNLTVTGSWSLTNNIVTRTFVLGGTYEEALVLTASGIKVYSESDSWTPPSDLVFDGGADGEIWTDTSVKQ